MVVISLGQGVTQKPRCGNLCCAGNPQRQGDRPPGHLRGAGWEDERKGAGTGGCWRKRWDQTRKDVTPAWGLGLVLLVSGSLWGSDTGQVCAENALQWGMIGPFHTLCLYLFSLPLSSPAPPVLYEDPHSLLMVRKKKK